ncbi:hypothetical protein GCM10027161_18140 [Microbispora hainanensis]
MSTAYKSAWQTVAWFGGMEAGKLGYVPEHDQSAAHAFFEGFMTAAGDYDE